MSKSKIVYTPTTKEYLNDLHELMNQTDFIKDKHDVWHKDKRLQHVKPGAMDPILIETLKHPSAPNAPESEITSKADFTPKTKADKTALQTRQTFGSYNFDLSTNILTKKVYANQHIPMEMYYPKDTQGHAPLPAMLYIHGGGFFAGAIDVTRNMCKYYAEKIPAVVFNVDYRIAPEYAAPAAADDCYEALTWIHQNAADLHVNADQIVVNGDSAGANLAAVIAYLDAKRNRRRLLAGQVELYPVVALDQKVSQKISWKLDDYHIVKDKKNADVYKDLTDSMDWMKHSNEIIDPTYGKDLSLDDPQLSPIMIPDDIAQKMPSALVVTDEFDYLRPQGYRYAALMAKNNVNAHYVNYKGMTHAFTDKFGIYPQAEDCAFEVVTWIRNLIKK